MFKLYKTINEMTSLRNFRNVQQFIKQNLNTNVRESITLEEQIEKEDTSYRTLRPVL